MPNAKNIEYVWKITYYPQSNGQVEVVNKIIEHTLKRKLEDMIGHGLKNYLMYPSLIE